MATPCSDSQCSFKCSDCEFTSDSQGGLGVHRVKKHKSSISNGIASVSIVCEYPQGKSFYCCLCDTITKSWPNFKRHFKNIHPNLPLHASAVCTLCNRLFDELKGIGVHLKRSHDISSATTVEPNSPSPIMSYANFIDSQDTNMLNVMDNSELSSPPSKLNRKKITRRTRNSALPLTSQCSNHPPAISSIAVPSTPFPSSPSLDTSPSPPPNDPSPSPSTNTDPMVTLIGRTAESISPPVSSLQPNPIPDESMTTPLSFPVADSMVAFSGCTADDVRSHDSSTSLVNPVVPNSTVALTGCTVPDGSTAIPEPDITPPIPPAVLRDLPVSTSDDDDPFDIPPPISPPRPNSQLPFPYTNNILNPSASTFQPATSPPVHPVAVPHQPSISPDLFSSPPTSTIPNPSIPTSVTIDNDPVPNQTFPSSATEPNSFHEFNNKWSSTFSSNSNWQEFSDKCYQFAKEVILECDKNFQNRKRAAPRQPGRPSARPVNNNRRPLQYNPIEARRIQSLYRLSKKRAARQVLNDSKPSYSGSVDDATEFFKNIFSEKVVDADKVKSCLNEFVPSGPADDTLGDPISSAEVSKKLRSLSNTAPGADRVEYRHLKSVDPNGKVLSSIFNRCLLQNDVPSQWKSSRTILIHKKGDASDISNFRPIALMSCIYKLFMSIMANRLVNYSIENNFLSNCQKSARPVEGCYEHTFVLQSLVLDAIRHQKNLFLSWLDLRNAFGSIPHEIISITLTHLGVPDRVVSLIKNVYTDAFTEIRTPAGNTPNIPINAGVKQGCPLSPILFNLCTEIILRSISTKGHNIGPTKHLDTEISVLAYADDLVLIAKNKAKLQQLLDAASSSADLIGLEFRPDKCASLSLTRSKRYLNNIELNDFRIQGKVMPALKEHEHYRYLGVPIGVLRSVDNIDSLVDDLCNDLEKIRSSLLAPWQKLDAIRTFVQPCLTFALRAGEPLKQSLSDYKKKLVEVVRSICNLPHRATSLIIFASTKVGGLGFQDPFTEVDIQTVVQAIRMLSSSDPCVSNIAKAELRNAVRFATQSDPSPALTSDFLSGSTHGKLNPKTMRYRTHSLWTRARKSCRSLKITITVPDNGAPSISTNNKGPCLAKSASAFLHRLVQDRVSSKLMDLPDQGKVARALVKDTFGNGSSWLYTGLNMRFSDWRFIHRARLNVVPTNQNKTRWSDCSPLCRVCKSHPETLPHIICHCPTNMVQIRDRHNQIVNRLANAVRYGQIRIDQQIPGIDDLCRPDLVIENNNEITIIDVTCPFENGDDALAKADYAKVTKYNHLKHHFQQLGFTCNVFGFVIGALGAWHSNNEAVLNNLQMTRSYKSLFRKLCCSDVIRGSAEIYYNHINVI